MALVARTLFVLKMDTFSRFNIEKRTCLAKMNFQLLLYFSEVNV